MQPSDDKRSPVEDPSPLTQAAMAPASTSAVLSAQWLTKRYGGRAVVDGVAGARRVDPSQLGQPFAGRTALPPPFDRLIHDRDRAGTGRVPAGHR